MYDFYSPYPVHLYGLNLIIIADEYDDSPATFIPYDAGSDRQLRDSD